MHTSPKKKLISVVTPCYNEEESIEDCCRVVRMIIEENLPEYDYEHIFCDNASTDRTLAILKELARTDPRVKIIVNSRNFGPGPSGLNGILATSGDAVFPFIPADMQDPPDLIPTFVRKWEEGYQVVAGVRKKRTEQFLMVMVRKLYYRIVSKIANVQNMNITADVGDFQLLDRRLIEALRRFDDYDPYFRGMVAHCGYRTAHVDYTWRARAKGTSKSDLGHLLDVGLNGLLSFSKIPLRTCLLVGLFVAFTSFCWGIGLLLYGLMAYQGGGPGPMSILVAIFFFGGLQMFFLGIMGEYIAAIHSQVRKKPNVLELERINFDRPAVRVAEPNGVVQHN